MTFDVDHLKDHIPYYLTEPDRRELVENLKALSRGVTTGYYVSAARDPDAASMLQGDGWRGFQIFSFETGERRSIRGIVLSNSCDISTSNPRPIAPKVVFAPLVRLSAVEARLKSRNLPEEAISERISAMKSQEVTNIFYLPAGGSLDEDHVVLLDDLHSMPSSAHANDEKIFTLSMAGFYLFAFKLSVHFCRLRENVDRRPALSSPA